MMQSMSSILRDPLFKRDINYIKNLEQKNKDVQDRIWEKLIGAYKKKEEDIRIVNSKFESHPVGLSSDSDNSTLSDSNENLESEPTFEISADHLKIVGVEKTKSPLISPIALNDTIREKLRKEVKQHLKNGTLDKFEIGKIGERKLKGVKFEKKIVTGGKNLLPNPETGDSSHTSEIDSSKFSSNKTSCESFTPNFRKVETQNDVELGAIKGISNGTDRRIKSKKKLRSHVDKDKPLESKAKRNKKKNIPNNPIEMKKAQHHIEKCICTIQDIRLILDQGNVPPDGSEDYTRRQQRTKEFTSRFSRVYMYPLIRQLSETEPPESRSVNCSKFTNMFHLIHQGLLAFFNHFPSTVGTTSHRKLKEHLGCTIQVCEKNAKLLEKGIKCENGDYLSVLKSRCDDLMQKLNDRFLSNSVHSILKSSTRTSFMPVSQPSRNIWPANRRSFDKRFSMYNTPLASKRESQWRRIMIQSCEARKPKVKSRYRTATFKHRPPPDRRTCHITSPGQYRLDDKRCLGALRNTPITTPMNEDSIQTMIQYDKQKNESEDDERQVVGTNSETHNDNYPLETETGENSQVKSGNLNQDDVLTKLLQLEDSDNKLTNTILVLQQCLNFKKQNPDLFKKMTENGDVQQNKMTVKHILEENYEKKTPRMSVKGTSEAQLICIKNDKSISAHSSETGEQMKQQLTKNSSSNMKVVSTELKPSSQFLIRKKIEKKTSIGNIKICRVNKQRKMLQLLPKEFAINVIQYKLAFHKHHKDNYMYKKTPNIKPWEVMDRISEVIMDFALLGISKEIEVNELLEKIYNSEFQY